MKIILVMVSSADGKTTTWAKSASHGWSSKEDGEHFRLLKSKHRLIVMGRKTYEQIKNELVLTPHTRRIVITRKPTDFLHEAVAGQLEFSDEPPLILVRRLESLGFDTMLLVGGSELNGEFLKAKLINECYITIEPRFFGSGKSLFTGTHVDIRLKLLEVHTLNGQGTLMLHYSLQYDH